MSKKKVGENRYWLDVHVLRQGSDLRRRELFSGTKDQAEEREMQLKKELREGQQTGNSLIIAPQKLKHMLRLHIEKKGPFSAGWEEKILNMEKQFGDMGINLFPDRLERFLGLLRANGKNNLANRYIDIAHAAYATCVELELVKHNPISKVRFPSTKEHARDNYVSMEEITNIILIAAKDRRTCQIARALQYLAHVPCRRGEVTRMKIGDIDIFNRRIRVYNGTTKNDIGIWKPIPPLMLKWFKWRLRVARKNDDPVFFRKITGTRTKRKGVGGRIVPLGDFKHSWDTVREAAGYPTLRIHDLRHISATNLVNAGTPRTVVNAIAGWRTDMLKSYYHLDNDAALTLAKWPEPPVKEKLADLKTANAD